MLIYILNKISYNDNRFNDIKDEIISNKNKIIDKFNKDGVDCDELWFFESEL